MHRNDQKHFNYIDSIWKKTVSLILTLNSLTYKHTFHFISKYHEISKSKLPMKNADGIHVLHI